MLNRLRYMGKLLIFTLSLGALVVVAAPSDQLQNLKLKIEQARDAGADDLAPMSLRLAESELSRAQRAVNHDSTHPLSVEHALDMVSYRVEELRQVLNALKAAGFSMNEETALRRVRETQPYLSPRLSKHEAVE